LTPPREELARAILQLQTQLKELPAGREAERTKLLEELNENQQRLRTLDEEFNELRRQRIRADYLATLQACEQARRAEKQSFEQLRGEWMQQQRELHREVRSLSEQLKAALEQGRAEAQRLQQQIDRLHTDLGGMGQTADRMERERVEAQVRLKEEVQRLHGQFDELRGELGQMQGTLNMMLSPLGRGTVGSAGYPWGW
jgi:chromosome segregation ATPase